jgi:hypothetical protein
MKYEDKQTDKSNFPLCFHFIRRKHQLYVSNGTEFLMKIKYMFSANVLRAVTPNNTVFDLFDLILRF